MVELSSSKLVVFISSEIGAISAVAGTAVSVDGTNDDEGLSVTCAVVVEDFLAFNALFRYTFMCTECE